MIHWIHDINNRPSQWIMMFLVVIVVLLQSFKSIYIYIYIYIYDGTRCHEQAACSQDKGSCALANLHFLQEQSNGIINFN
jgi:hypothetical protein